MDDKAFIATMEEVCTERGEFVYPLRQKGWTDQNPYVMCLYVRTDVDEPACLIGTVLHRMGVRLEDLRTREGVNAEDLLGEFAPGTSVAVRIAATHAQTAQDLGKPWGECLRTFRRVLDDLRMEA